MARSRRIHPRADPVASQIGPSRDQVWGSRAHLFGPRREFESYGQRQPNRISRSFGGAWQRWLRGHRPYRRHHWTQKEYDKTLMITEVSEILPTLPLKDIPELGQVVKVRSRRYLVDAVAQARDRSWEQTLVDLSCLEDDAQGEHLSVLWSASPTPRSSSKLTGATSPVRVSTHPTSSQPTSTRFVGTS